MQLFTTVPLSGEAKERLGEGCRAIWCGSSVWDPRQAAGKSFQEEACGMLDGGVARARGRAGSIRRSQESNFYTVFCKNGKPR